MKDKIFDLISVALVVFFSVWFGIVGTKYFAGIFNADSSSLNNETVLFGLLQVLLAFAALISYFIYQVISNKIEKLSNRMLEEERNISKAELFKSTAYFHFRTYEKYIDEIIDISNKIKSVKKDGENKKTAQQKQKLDFKINQLLKKSLKKYGSSNKELESVMYNVGKAIDFLEDEKNKTGRCELKKEKDLLMCKCKNNHAYYICKKWEFKIRFIMNEKESLTERNQEYLESHIDENDGLTERNRKDFESYLDNNKEEKKAFEGAKQDVQESIGYLIENRCSNEFKFMSTNIADTKNCAKDVFLIPPKEELPHSDLEVIFGILRRLFFKK